MADGPIGGTMILANGVAMPRIGLGVFRAAATETREAVASALALGYRHVDSARIYGNEAETGAAVLDSGIPRAEVFVTTKLWNQDHGYDRALSAFETSRAALGLDVVDLYLIHWPVQKLRLESWRALERLYEEGAVRAIGVSNFMVPHLEELAARANVMPHVNQIEVHPFLQQQDVRDWCARNGVAVEAYSPLAKAAALSDPTVFDVAREARATPAQVLLAWGLGHGMTVLPKSVRPQRQAENLAAAGVSLTPAQIARLDELERGMATGWDPRKAP
jgi:diketogulonate reductase-like aldo/keto reductase